MNKGTAILCLCLAGCATVVHTPPEPATHWIRSDDFAEYSGLYLYSETPDGQLWLTHYPEKRPTRPEQTKHVGFWTENNGVLTWFDQQMKTSTVFKAYTKGIYLEQDGKYYSPVMLMSVPVVDGQPKYEN